MEMQTNLVGEDAEKAFEKLEQDMEKEKMESSPYFTPVKDKKHILTFSGWATSVKEFTKRDAKKQEIKDENGNPVKERKSCLILWVDSIDGEDATALGPDEAPHPGKEWTITSKNLIETMRMACENGNILKKKFQVRKTGESFHTKYGVSEVGDR